MAAGSDEADRAQSSLHTLGRRGMLVTEDTYDGAPDEARPIFHEKCAVHGRQFTASFHLLLPSNHEALLVPVSLLPRCLQGVPRKK